MPRKKRKPSAEPTPLSEILENSPIAETIRESQEGSPLTKLMRERGLKTADELETPQEKPKVKSWGETVRGWQSWGSTGVKHVSTTSPNMVGIQFLKGKERTREEKAEMETAGMRFFNDAQAWLKPNKGDAFDETRLMALRFADRRRRDEAEYVGR